MLVATAGELTDPDAEMLMLLEELAQRLSGFERDLLRWHVRDGKSLSRIAEELGMNRRTIRRAWLRLQRHAREELAG